MFKRALRVQEAEREAKRRRRAALLGDEHDEPENEPGPVLMDMGMANVQRGVTLTWLHYVFKRDRNTCKQLLASCPVVRHGAGNAAYYDVAEAAQYLVKPKLDIKGILRTLKEQDLPDDLKPKIWEAKLKRQRWEEKAGDLWRTQKVLDVFDDVFKAMRNSMQLWADNLAEEQIVSEMQREAIRRKVDELQALLHATLEEVASKRSTASQLVEADENPDFYEEENAS